MWEYVYSNTSFNPEYSRYFCQRCEERIHLFNYEPSKKMCFNCIMLDEVDEQQHRQFKRWYNNDYE